LDPNASYTLKGENLGEGYFEVDGIYTHGPAASHSISPTDRSTSNSQISKSTVAGIAAGISVIFLLLLIALFRRTQETRRMMGRRFGVGDYGIGGGASRRGEGGAGGGRGERERDGGGGAGGGGIGAKRKSNETTDIDGDADGDIEKNAGAEDDIGVARLSKDPGLGISASGNGAGSGAGRQIKFDLKEKTGRVEVST
jgi:hypothetical protein